MGFESAKDVIEVVLVPLAIAAIAIAWEPIRAAWRRRNFRSLVVRELSEAGPRRLTEGSPWPTWLTRRFTHEVIIRDPGEHLDFLLGLDPTLVYHLSQMWISFEKGKALATEGDTSATEVDQALKEHAIQWGYHFAEVAKLVDRGTHGLDEVASRWARELGLANTGPPGDDPQNLTPDSLEAR